MLKTIILISALVSFSAFSEEAKTKKSSPKVVAEVTPSYPELSDVRCEKLSGHNLVEFKAALVENCDLNKPFSSSLSRVLNEDTYFYCCQIKK